MQIPLVEDAAATGRLSIAAVLAVFAVFAGISVGSRKTILTVRTVCPIESIRAGRSLSRVLLDDGAAQRQTAACSVEDRAAQRLSAAAGKVAGDLRIGNGQVSVVIDRAAACRAVGRGARRAALGDGTLLHRHLARDD